MSEISSLPELTSTQVASIHLEIRAAQAGRSPFVQACLEVEEQRIADEIAALNAPPEQDVPTILSKLGTLASTTLGFLPIPNTRKL